MSEIIKVSKKLKNISSFTTAGIVFKSDVEQQKEDYKKLLKNEYDKGFADGQQIIKDKLENEYKVKLKEKYNELNDLMASLNNGAEQLKSNFEKVAIEIAFNLAEIVVKREIERESIINKVLEKSLNKVIGANDIIVKLNPKDYDTIIADGKTFIAQDSFSHIKFDKDERIELGGCYIESEIGNADGRISSQINELKRKLEIEFSDQN